MEFSRQEYWSGLPFPSPGGLSNPGIESVSPVLQVDSLPLNHPGSPDPRLCGQNMTNHRNGGKGTQPPGVVMAGRMLPSIFGLATGNLVI